MSAPAFIHLRVHSAYSLLEGAIGLKDLLKWCGKQKMPAVAVTDSANLFGSLEFAQSAKDMGIQPIMGCVLQIMSEQEENPRNRTGHIEREQLLLLAQNNDGWHNLVKLVSKAYLAPAGGEAPLLSYADLEAHTEGLIILTGGIHGGIGKALLTGRTQNARARLLWLMERYPGRVYIELMRHGVADEQHIEPALIQLAVEENVPLVATNDAYFIDRAMYEAHDAFLCIADGTYVEEEKRRRLTPEHRLKTPAEMQALFADIPEALANSVMIARRCAVMAPAKPPLLPNFTDESGNTDADAMLREQARAGLEERLQSHVFTPEMDEAERARVAQPYRERLEFECQTIINMKFPGYFLIVSDFIKWSKSQGIPVGPGRGSGAGSLVAWSLSITDLNPLRYGLLFERFLNPERVSMPDFDVDFCQDRRDEVIAYVQQKYGRDRVAQIITFGKLQARAVLRDVGRVLQMPYGQVDKICKLVPNNPASPVTLAEAINMEPILQATIKEDETVQKLADISLKLEGLNRHASTHAAGVVIADRPLDELVPMYRDPKSDMPVVQYSMKYAEMAGLVKFDFLGLKTLTVLVKAVELIRARGIEVDLLKLPEGDKATYEMLGRGDTVGVFQLESAGMRDTLKKMKPDCLEDIIALVSLYRPGPMDNIPTYIARKHGLEKPNYLHPKLEPVLKETFGVIIYQEQVMQIAQVLAGYSLGEADLLRRAMGKKIRAEMEAQRDIFVRKSVENGVDKNQAAGIFDLIAKFAEYGFNKSHAAAYALIAYQTAYLKANFTVEFIAASMTYDMHNTDKLGIFREEAAKFGIQLLPPDVNASGVEFTVEYASSPFKGEGRGGGHASDIRTSSAPTLTLPLHGGGHIRYALAAVRNVGAQAMQMVVEERTRGGAFAGIDDFMQRTHSQALNKRGLEHLIKAGALDKLNSNRAALFASLDTLIGYAQSMEEERVSAQENLFGGGNASGSLPAPALAAIPDWPTLERLHEEFGAIGFYLSAHPMEAYTSTLKAMNITSSAQFADRLGEKYGPLKVAGIVTGRKFKVSDKGRFAFVQLFDMGGVFEVSVFNEELLAAQRERLEPGNILFMQADGKKDEGGIRLIAQSISALDDEMQKVRTVFSLPKLRIVVENNAAMADIRLLLKASGGNSGTQVTLAAQLAESKSAEIALPGKYAITPAVLDKLRIIKGIKVAEGA